MKNFVNALLVVSVLVVAANMQAKNGPEEFHPAAPIAQPIGLIMPDPAGFAPLSAEQRAARDAYALANRELHRAIRHHEPRVVLDALADQVNALAPAAGQPNIAVRRRNQ